MASAHENQGFDPIINYFETELSRVLGRFSRADAIATSNGNYTQALAFGLGAVLAAVHRHLGLIPAVFVVVGGAVTLWGMLMSALSWNPTRTRGGLSDFAASHFPSRAFVCQEQRSRLSDLASHVEFSADFDDAAVRCKIADDLNRKLTAATDLAEWSERRAALLALFYGVGVLLIAAGTVAGLA